MNVNIFALCVTNVLQNVTILFPIKNFTKKIHLTRHIKEHTGEKEIYNKFHLYNCNFRCQACGESFKRKLKLDEHVAKEHSKDRTQNVVKVQQILPYNSKLKDVCLSETLYSAFPIGNN